MYTVSLTVKFSKMRSQSEIKDVCLYIFETCNELISETKCGELL